MILDIGNICEFHGESEQSSVVNCLCATVCNNDKTLHLLFSSYHWECRSESGHRYEISSGGDGNCQL